MVTEQSHGQYLLLLRVTNVKDPDIDRFAKQIHEAYMAQYGSAGAITVAVLKLGEIFKAGTNAQQPTGWQYAVRYFGPRPSVAFLQEQLESAAKEMKGQVETLTFTITSDITGRY